MRKKQSERLELLIYITASIRCAAIAGIIITAAVISAAHKASRQIDVLALIISINGALRIILTIAKVSRPAGTCCLINATEFYGNNFKAFSFAVNKPQSDFLFVGHFFASL